MMEALPANFSDLAHLLTNFAKILIVFLIAWMLLRANKKLRRTMLKSRMNFDPGWIVLLSKIITVFISSLALLVILQVLGFNVTPFLAFGGIGAALMGIAGKDLISNLSGGWMIHFTRPFSFQDLVELPQKNLVGYVEKIGWHSTAIRSKNTQLIWVPNSLFITEVIINQSRMTHRRLDEVFYVSIDKIDSLPELTKKIYQFLAEHSEVDPKQLLDVHVTGFSSVSAEITATIHIHKTKTEEYMEVRQLLLLEICRLIQEKGVKLSYPIGQAHLYRTSLKSWPEDRSESSRD